MDVRYNLTLEDHLAWYDYYLTTPAGVGLRSSLPIVSGFVDRLKRRRFARKVILPPSRHALGERTLEATEHGLREFSPDFSFTITWSDLVLAATTSTHLFIAHKSMNAHIVPFRFFESDAKREAFVSFAKSHIQTKASDQPRAPATKPSH